MKDVPGCTALSSSEEGFKESPARRLHWRSGTTTISEMACSEGFLWSIPPPEAGKKNIEMLTKIVSTLTKPVLPVGGILLKDR